MTDLSHIRREYIKGGLHRCDLTKNPLDFFLNWLQQAKDAQLLDPTAMSIATVDLNGQPWQRIVLLKRVNAQGLVFFTNLESRKSQHIKQNAKVSLLFSWHELERQVAITGSAEKLSNTEVLKYFITRPKESQIAAWVSKQSSPLTAKQALEAKFLEMKNKFSKGEVPLPKFWGGYIVKPDTFEFWQGGKHRLHDRFLYEQNESTDKQNTWKINRLAP